MDSWRSLDQAAQCRTAFARILSLDGFEPALRQRSGLGVLDRTLHVPLSIGIADACRIGHHPVMREHRLIHRVQLRGIDVRVVTIEPTRMVADWEGCLETRG